MLATEPAPVASPSEGHRVAAQTRADGRDGAEKSEGHPKGAERLAAFARAPEPVQRAFWQAIAKATARTTAADLAAFQVHGVSARRIPAPCGVAWDQTWRTRAYNHRLREERGTRANGFDEADAELLKSISAVEYVEALTGEPLDGAGKMCCPLPDHEERTPSFTTRETRWRCFGCGKHGTIYDLASALWAMPLRGPEFLDLHRRLMERFA